MERIILRKWFYLPVSGFVIFVLGIILWLVGFGGSSVLLERPDRVVLHGAVSPTSDNTGNEIIGAQAVPLPLTATDAVAAGWTEFRGECKQKQGRMFHKEQEPYVLIYKRDGTLLAMYLYSKQEMPSPPWRFFEAKTTKGKIGLLTALKFPYLGFDHWALTIYFKTGAMPCSGAGYIHPLRAPIDPIEF